MTIMYTETPAEAFDAIEAVYMYADHIRETVTVARYEQGDEVTIELDYRDPEGKRVDVDAYRATWEEEAYVLDFGYELPED